MTRRPWSRIDTPPELGPTLTVRQAAAALGMAERTLRRYLKRRVVQGEQFLPHSPWIIPTTEVERVAEVLNTSPDWRAAVHVTEVAIVASPNRP